MAYEFKLPDLGEGLTEGEIARWLVTEGQEVAEDDPLVEIQTDKTTVEIPSPAAGTVSRILAAEGDVVPVGSVIVVIGNGTAAPSRDQRVSGSEPQASLRAERPSDAKVRATPLVRRLAQELGVDLESVTPTGPQGRVLEDDVRAAATGVSGSEPRTPSGSEGTRVPLRGVRRVIAEHLTRAHREIPAVTYVEECDFTGLDLARLVPLALRAAAAVAARRCPSSTPASRATRSCCSTATTSASPSRRSRASWSPSCAAATTLRGRAPAEDVARLADAARAGTLTPEELRGSTFSLTSAGRLGGLVVTPLVNHPEVGILDSTGSRRGPRFATGARRPRARKRVRHLRPPRRRRARAPRSSAWP